MTAGAQGYGPVRVWGTRDEGLTRWLWLVKWLLAIPHYIVLAVLWVAALVVSVIGWFAVLFTARYPRPLFDFVVGVLRWSWRVGFYAYSALGTDRYPPFALGPRPDYPAGLEVDYPERLSRGLVLVKAWLLALPHYLVVALLTSGVGGIGWGRGYGHGAMVAAPAGGVLSLLVLFAAVALLFTGRYPGGIFDLVVGINRWANRVAAYALLLTDAYPPFRLDQGGEDPGGRPAGQVPQ